MNAPVIQLYQPKQTLQVIDGKGEKLIVSNIDVTVYANQSLILANVEFFDTPDPVIKKIKLTLQVDGPVGIWTGTASLEKIITEYPAYEGFWYFVTAVVILDPILKEEGGGVTNTINSNGEIEYPD